MRRCSLVLIVLAVCSFILLPALDRDAHGRGKGGGGGPKLFRGGRGGGRSFLPGGRGGGFKGGPFKHGGLPGLNKGGPAGIGKALTGRGNALAVQQGNEARILSQRQATAQMLRNLSARNGNQNLLRTANMMDQHALSHYTMRQAQLQKFGNGNLPLNQQSPLSPLNSPLNTPMTRSQLSQLSPTTFQQRQLFNEQQKLYHQLSVAQQLRDISAQNGNANLLRTATQMENMATTRYLSQVGRYGLLQNAAPLPAPLPPTALLPVTAPVAPVTPLTPVGTSIVPIVR